MLKTGWGVFLAVTGGLALFLDIISPFLLVRIDNGRSVPIFDSGSFTLGWISVVLITVIPPAIFRSRLKRPISGGLAVLWCAAALFACMLLRALASNPNQVNNTGSLGIVAGTFVAWALLTWKEDLFAQGEKESSQIPDQNPPRTRFLNTRRICSLLIFLAGIGIFSVGLTLRWKATDLSLYRIAESEEVGLNPNKKEAYAAISGYLVALGVVLSGIGSWTYIREQEAAAFKQ